MLTHKERLDFYNQKWTHTIMVHTIPAYCAIVLMAINDAVLIKEQSFKLLVMGLAYGAVNYYSVVYQRDGKPIYWFLTWKDKWSFVYFAVIAFGFTGFFYLLALMDELITGRTTTIKKGIKKYN